MTKCQCSQGSCCYDLDYYGFCSRSATTTTKIHGASVPVCTPCYSARDFTAKDMESLRNAMSAMEISVEEATATIRKSVEAASRFLRSDDFRSAAVYLSYAADTSRYLDDEIHGWLREFQARRIA